MKKIKNIFIIFSMRQSFDLSLNLFIIIKIKEDFMWCLETIIELNQKAIEAYIDGRHLAEAYKDVGINSNIQDSNDIFDQNELNEIASSLKGDHVNITSSRWI